MNYNLSVLIRTVLEALTKYAVCHCHLPTRNGARNMQSIECILYLLHTSYFILLLDLKLFNLFNIYPWVIRSHPIPTLFISLLQPTPFRLETSFSCSLTNPHLLFRQKPNPLSTSFSSPLCRSCIHSQRFTASPFPART
jgi:hypothetical protein